MFGFDADEDMPDAPPAGLAGGLSPLECRIAATLELHCTTDGTRVSVTLGSPRSELLRHCNYYWENTICVNDRCGLIQKGFLHASAHGRTCMITSCVTRLCRVCSAPCISIRQRGSTTSRFSLMLFRLWLWVALRCLSSLNVSNDFSCL